MIRGMAVSDIPAEKILNARTSYAELLYYIPQRDRYRWDADHTYMAAMGYPAVDGQVLPPASPPPFPLDQLTYLDSRYQLIGQPITPRSRRVVVTGDSIDQHRDQNGAKPYLGGSLWSYLGLWSKQRFNLARNVAVGGRTTAQMLAGFQSEVVAYSPGIVVIGGGRNDINGGVPTATTRANISQMVALARQNGIEPVLHTLAPVDIAGGGAFNSIEKNRQGTIAHNVWLKKLATDLNVAVIDLWSLWADKKTGAWLPTLSTDGVHPTDTAIFVAVRSLVGYMPAIFAGRAPLPTDNFYPGNLLGNALATTDNNVDGLPDGWYFPAPAKISLVEADYGKRVVILAGDYTPAYSAGFPAEKAMDPAKTYALTGVVSHDRGVQATIQVVDQSYQNVATAIVSNEGPLVDGVFYVEFTGNAAIKNLFVLTQVNGPGGSASISRLSVSEVSFGAAVPSQLLSPRVQEQLARGEDAWTRYGISARQITEGSDLNGFRASGIYRGNALVNAPNSEWFFYEMISHGSDYLLQRATQFTGAERGNVYERLRYADTWEIWRLVQSRAIRFSATAGAFTKPGGTFNKVMFSSVQEDTASAFDANSSEFVVPTAGVYDISAMIRPSDFSVAGVGVGFGVGAEQADVPTFAWYNGGQMRNTFVYARAQFFQKGERVRAYFYTDNETLFTNANIALTLIQPA